MTAYSHVSNMLPNEILCHITTYSLFPHVRLVCKLMRDRYDNDLPLKMWAAVDSLVIDRLGREGARKRKDHISHTDANVIKSVNIDDLYRYNDRALASLSLPPAGLCEMLVNLCCQRNDGHDQTVPFRMLMNLVDPLLLNVRSSYTARLYAHCMAGAVYNGHVGIIDCLRSMGVRMHRFSWHHDDMVLTDILQYLVRTETTEYLVDRLRDLFINTIRSIYSMSDGRIMVPMFVMATERWMNACMDTATNTLRWVCNHMELEEHLIYTMQDAKEAHQYLIDTLESILRDLFGEYVSASDIRQCRMRIMASRSDPRDKSEWHHEVVTSNMDRLYGGDPLSMIVKRTRHRKGKKISGMYW